ncbi:MAG: RHS repeat-associated core domain-containing protein, partial [Proteobacteria bacterium]|nr:RHS repeat-associated core domain-containing protein [Pseudomonadota bacterium]
YRKTQGTTVTDITYDALNRLTQVNKTGIDTQSYTYDHEGRRISKTVGTSTTNFLYNGPDIIAEYTNWTTAAAQYTHGPNTDDPIIRTAGTERRYYHQDGLGSVVAMSNQTGTITVTQRFDAWGNKIDSSGTIPQYGYTGREPDETGLVYYRARYYDPTIGRFTQRDPIGMNAGINPYAYVNANPVNFTDPMGLMAFNNSQTKVIVQNTSYYNTTSDISLGQGMNANQSSTVVNMAADVGTFVGQQLGDAGFTRSQYLQAAANLEPTDRLNRTLLKVALREETPILVREPLEFIRPSVDAKPGSFNSANVTNPTANMWGSIFKYSGTALLLASVAYDVYQVAKSSDPFKALAESSVGVLGSLAGGSFGAAFGSVAPVVGTIAGGVAGAAAGGYTGRILGGAIYNYTSGIGSTIYDYLHH